VGFARKTGPSPLIIPFFYDKSLIPEEKQSDKCPHHNVKFDHYCADCEQLICPRCIHQDHKLLSIADAASQGKEDLKQSILQLKARQKKVKISKIHGELTLDTLETNRDEAERGVVSHFKQLHQLLDMQQAKFLQKLDKEYGHKLKPLKLQQDELQFIETSMDAAVGFSHDLIQSASDLEILTLKKMLLERHANLKKIPFQRLPEAEPWIFYLENQQSQEQTELMLEGSASLLNSVP